LPANATEEQRIERTRQEWSNKAKVESSYRNWFPGAHLRYDLKAGLMARMSYSEGIGRPNFSNLKPLTRVNIDTLSIQQNNVALKPQESNNYDLSLEYYFEPVGLLSATVFRKQIKNFISNVNVALTPALLSEYGLDSQYQGWDFRTQTNTGDGEIEGFELAYNQHLSGFASWLRGFSIMANYTKAKGRGRLEEIIPVIWNFGLVYEQRPWTVRFQLNYQDQYLTSRSTDPMQSRFVEEQLNADINLQYRFSPKLSVFVDYTNAFGETITRTTGEGVFLPQQVIDIGRRVNFGLRGRF
jgi:TonB-dependent receptor